MATMSAATHPRHPSWDDDICGPQPTAADALPDPEPLLRNLTQGVLEVLAGVRDVTQLARWMTADVYESVSLRAGLAARARSARGVPVARPVHAIRSVHSTVASATAGEAVIVISGPARTRAVAMRLEGMDRRWRATSLALL